MWWVLWFHHKSTPSLLLLAVIPPFLIQCYTDCTFVGVCTSAFSWVQYKREALLEFAHGNFHKPEYQCLMKWLFYYFILFHICRLVFSIFLLHYTYHLMLVQLIQDSELFFLLNYHQEIWESEWLKRRGE